MTGKRSETEAVYTVLNPAGKRPDRDGVPLAARSEDLSGKVVYCVSQWVGGADIFLKKLADALPGFAPGVKTRFVHKRTTYMSDDPELWAEIETEGDAVIYGAGA